MVNMSSRYQLRRAAVALGLVALGACMPFHRKTTDQITPGPALVFFTNESLDQADVFAAGPGGANPVRIGTVMAGRTDTLTIPVEYTAPRGPVNIIARIPMSVGMQHQHLVPATGPVWIYPAQASRVTLRSDEGILGFVTLDQ